MSFVCDCGYEVVSSNVCDSCGYELELDEFEESEDDEFEETSYASSCF